MTAIFISYRRDDSAGHAGRVFDRLVARYGESAVFIDHHDLAPGTDFSEAIEANIEQAQAVLAIIGPRWVDARNAAGQRRLEQPDDFVRRELLYALNAGKQVIPLLVGGAKVPAEAELPEELAGLVRLQACELRDARFDDDFHALVGCLPDLESHPASPEVESLAGSWIAQVTYPWQVTATEKFDFEIDAGELFGTGTFLAASRPLEDGELLEDGARFTLHSHAVMGDAERSVTHRYRVRVDGNSLHVRMQSSGGFNDDPPVKFIARRS